MRAETLFRVTLQIFLDIRDTKSDTYLESLVAALQGLVSDDSKPAREKVEAARGELRASLQKSAFNNISPAELEIISSLDALPLLGQGLIKEVDSAFEGNHVTPALSQAKVEELRSRVVELKSESDQITDSFTFFGLEEDSLVPGEFEIMIAIPGAAVDCELGQFGREAMRLNQVVGVFTELATGSREPAKIRAISSSDLTFYLESIPAVAAMLAVAIERIAALYDKILGIIKLHRELKKYSLPEELTTPIKEFVDKQVELGLEEVAKEIEKKNLSKIETSRRQEIKTELRNSLRQIAARLDRGYTFDVRGEDLPQAPAGQDTDSAQTANAKVIGTAYKIVQEIRPRLRHFTPEKEPILGLPEPSNDHE